MAVHVVRTPAFRMYLRVVTEDAIDDFRREKRVPPESFENAAKRFRGARMHIDALLGQITRIASVLCSMRWSLVDFGENLLATSDQPVVALPMVAGRSISMDSVVPRDGFRDTIEVRLPIDPRMLLLLTCHDDPDPVAKLRGTFAQACSVNCAVRAQAEREWFYKPGIISHRLSPTHLQPVIFPVSVELLSNYQVRVAQISTQRQAANRLIDRMIRDNAPRDQVRWVVRTGSKAA